MSFQSSCFCRLASAVLVLVFAHQAHAAEAELSSIKARLPFIPLGRLLSNHPPDGRFEGAEPLAAWRTLQELRSPALEVAELEALTHHADADLRALALLGLLAKESHRAIACSVSLLNDSAPTLPLLVNVFDNSSFTATASRLEVQTRPQTVGNIAARILEQVEGYPRTDDQGKLRLEPDNDTWWALREDNPDWLAWYNFLYLRATASHGTLPPEHEKAQKEDFQRLRKTIDSLPPVTKGWGTLHLADHMLMNGDTEWDGRYATEEEMLQAIKPLGAEDLLMFLRGHPRAGLRGPPPRQNEQGKRFILAHARDFFTAQHAETLLYMQLYTAAADANPQMVRRYARTGMLAFSQGHNGSRAGELMAALACLGDATDRETAIDWFYHESNAGDDAEAQRAFIRAAEHRGPPHWKEIVRQVIAHPSFDQLGPYEVMSLAMAVEKITGKHIPQPSHAPEDNADTTRSRLREWYQVAKLPEPQHLEAPQQFLQTPLWTFHLKEEGHSLALSPGGQLLAVGMAKAPAVCLVDAHTGREVRKLLLPADESRIAFNSSEVAFNSSDEDLIITSKGGTTAIYSTSRDEVISHSKSATEELLLPASTGRHAASIDTEFLAWLQLPDRSPVWRQQHLSRWPHPAVLSPDARSMALNNGWRKSIQILDTQTGKFSHTLMGHATQPAKLSFSPDSRLLASVGGDHRVFVWSVKDGRAVSRFRGNAVAFGPVAFTHDSKSFIVAAGHEALGVYDIADGRLRVGIRTTSGNWKEQALFSRDDKCLYLMIRVPGDHSYIECWQLP